MEDTRGQIEAVSRLYQQLDEKISDKGGMGNLFGMHRKIREALEAISIGELDSFLSEIQRARETLNRLQEHIDEIRLLKEVFATASRLNSAGQRM